MNVLGIWELLEKWSNALKEFMLTNDKSPIVYGGIFLLGIGIFAIAYSALHKDN